MNLNSSISGLVLTASAQAMNRYQDYVEDRYREDFAYPDPPLGCRNWKRLHLERYSKPSQSTDEGSTAISIRDIRRNINCSVISTERSSPLRRRVTFIEHRSIQLEREDVKGQLKELFDKEYPATEILRILLEPTDQLQFENPEDLYAALIEGLRDLISDACKGEREKIFKHLSELSLYTESHPLLRNLGKEVEDRTILCKSIVSLHNKKGSIMEVLHSFVLLEMEEEKVDPNSFRRSDQLAYLLCGEAVRQLLRDKICVVMEEIRALASKQEVPQIGETALNAIFRILRETPELLLLFKAGCVDPIREKFGDADAAEVDELIQVGAIDMLFLRGISPLLSAHLEGEDFKSYDRRIRVVRFILDSIKVDSIPWQRLFKDL